LESLRDFLATDIFSVPIIAALILYGLFHVWRRPKFQSFLKRLFPDHPPEEGSDDPRGRARVRFLKGVELFGVVIAAVAVIQEFGFKNPLDRERQQAELLTQLAELIIIIDNPDGPEQEDSGCKINRDENLGTISLAIRTTFEALVAENVPMRGVRIPHETNLREADLISAQLVLAKLSCVNLSLAHLKDADLEGADLSSASLDEADFSFANLKDANLKDADLALADLSFADLSFADLTGANLTGADLTGAILEDAILNGARLYGATGLTQEMLRSAHQSPPPKSLPEDLSWPFERSGGGEWRLKP